MGEPSRGQGDRPEAERLLAERSEARAARDFVRADSLRARIESLGFEVRDGPGGSELADPNVDGADAEIRPAVLDLSMHVIYEGFRDDLERFLAGMARSSGSFEVVVTDNASEDGSWIDGLAGHGVRILRFAESVGWAEAQNRAGRDSLGAVVAFADLSVEPRGDVVGPLLRVLEDPTIGVAGPWGLLTDDLREFREARGPEVHAVEGYLLAVRREVFSRASFDPWFKWYRHADLDLSFRIRGLGLKAMVVPLEAERHEHRGWSAVPEPERSARSRRNFYRFLNRWRDRSDLLRIGA